MPWNAMPANSNVSQSQGVTCYKIPGGPTGLINPIAANLITLYPHPNANNPSNFTNFVNEPVRKLDETKFDVRLDHNFSSADNAFARFSYDHATSYFPAHAAIANSPYSNFFC